MKHIRKFNETKKESSKKEKDQEVLFNAKDLIDENEPSIKTSEEDNEKIQKESENNAIIEFEKFVSNTMSNNSIDRVTALRWIIDGEYDIGYVEFQYGLPYGYIEKEVK